MDCYSHDTIRCLIDKGGLKTPYYAGKNLSKALEKRYPESTIKLFIDNVVTVLPEQLQSAQEFGYSENILQALRLKMPIQNYCTLL
jgi:hypothetical protein